MILNNESPTTDDDGAPEPGSSAALLTDRKQIPDATTAQLVATYNYLTGEKVSRFSSRAVGEVRVSNAWLGAEDRAAHLGVPKGAAPKMLGHEELTAREAAQSGGAPASGNPPDADAPGTEGEPVQAQKTKRRKASPRPAKKNAPAGRKTASAGRPAKAAKTPKPAKAGGGGRRSTYSRVRLVAEPEGAHRPQAASNRTKVLEALRKRRGSATIEQLSTDVGFDARSFVHKLVAVGCCEVEADGA